MPSNGSKRGDLMNSSIRPFLFCAVILLTQNDLLGNILKEIRVIRLGGDTILR
jgi:hypothetical protein